MKDGEISSIINSPAFTMFVATICTVILIEVGKKAYFEIQGITLLKDSEG